MNSLFDDGVFPRRIAPFGNLWIKALSGSPQLSPARVLLRRHVPRHSPCALLYLTRNIFSYAVVKVHRLQKQTAAALPHGDEGNRTLDPLLARQVLSQLSYTPTKSPPESGEL